MTGSLLIKNDKFYMVLNVYEGGKRKRKSVPVSFAKETSARQSKCCGKPSSSMSSSRM
jgi:hypothetical protein